MAQSDSSTCSTEIGYCATWSLILPSLGILTFQAPTKQIASEFIYTSNYWAARLSKEPLTEIVSNADYGWGSSLYNVLNATESQSPLSNSSSSSFNNSFKLFNSSLISSRSSNQRTPAKIKDWDPISHSMVISNLTEREQFEALKQYIHRVERDLKDHQNLKEKLTKVFIPGSLNWEKSNKNWAKKLDYLQKQKIRYSCYIKTLEKAFVDKERYPVKLVLKNNESTQELLK
ncbi:hypothetical protein NADFUDRAFT_45266 [Nadsonia fulvescens var. elongata DSM 6958]|uniref:Uncharacterized protein n=1 Tax=Nadsonia fulvescens var. elongata DSM 6958 TaxID=857566 RepID=A0A1E3PNM4_9ASCO|nr:hypothetical protein NADFUDRAFT_45266 [Nadsonia fulvescens var. elongata DSM 6958]